MNRIALVARREFLQIAKTRSFWLTLLILPAMLLLLPMLGSLSRNQPAPRYVIADISGQHAAAIERRMEIEQQHKVLDSLAAYVERSGLKPKAVNAVWALGPRAFSDQDVEAFIAAGGLEAAMREVGPLPAQVAAFRPPARAAFAAALPADIPTNRGAEAFGEAAGRYVRAKREKGVKPLAAAVYIPADFGAPGVIARIWTNGGSTGGLVDAVQHELGRATRIEAGRDAGLTVETATRLEATSPPVEVIAPPKGQGRDRIALQSLLPLAVAYLLLMSVFVSGAWLLQGMIEERSNKLMEAVLACVSPAELMYGKLIGIMGVGLSVIIVWIACALGGAFSAPGQMAQVIVPALAALQSPWMLLALVFYFITGYLICAMIFLTVGSVSESMTDAQAYLTPVMLILFLPFTVLSQLIANPDAMVAKVLSWIPIYTPFAMMARMGAGVEPYEVIGTSILLVAFVAAEFFLLSRVFQASLLRTGQPPKLGEFAKLMFSRAAK